MPRTPRSFRRQRRSGKILVIVALLIPTLLLIVALVVESGLTLSLQSELRTLCDSTARVVALKIQDGADEATVNVAAEDFVRAASQFPKSPELTLNIPPATGPHTGQEDYAEVLLSTELPFSLGKMWLPESGKITARAVSGVEPVSAGARIIALDASETPGLSISGGGRVRISGGVIVNSLGGGVDVEGQPVDGIPGPAAATVGGSAGLWADDVQVAGGVNDPSGFHPLVPGERPPLRTRVEGIEDPLADLPVPHASLGLDTTSRGAARVTMGTATVEKGNTVAPDGTVTLRPGVYESIEITGGKVVFRPGVYILTGGKANALAITGGAVDGSAGVMFYNTGSDFDALTGAPDLDPSVPAAKSTKFGGILINAGANLHPLSDASSPFNGMLIYQRRANSLPIEIQGDGTPGTMGGLIYAPQAMMKIAGKGTLNNQFVVGQFAKTGIGDLTIECSEAAPTRARKAFLVE